MNVNNLKGMSGLILVLALGFGNFIFITKVSALPLRTPKIVQKCAGEEAFKFDQTQIGSLHKKKARTLVDSIKKIEYQAKRSAFFLTFLFTVCSAFLSWAIVFQWVGSARLAVTCSLLISILLLAIVFQNFKMTREKIISAAAYMHLPMTSDSPQQMKFLWAQIKSEVDAMENLRASYRARSGHEISDKSTYGLGWEEYLLVKYELEIAMTLETREKQLEQNKKDLHILTDKECAPTLIL